jgi:hypothetical protein
MLDDTREIHLTPEPTMKRDAWYLLTGLILGVILGLFYTWVIDPVVYETTLPANLREEDKNTYRHMIAQVYAAAGNLERAALRLEVLADDDPVYALGAQAQKSLAEGHPDEARALALLASALQESTDSLIPPTSTETREGMPTHTLPVSTSAP